MVVAAAVVLALASAAIALPIWALAVHAPRVLGLLVVLVPVAALVVRAVRRGVRSRVGRGAVLRGLLVAASLASLGRGVIGGGMALVAVGGLVLVSVVAWRQGGSG